MSGPRGHELCAEREPGMRVDHALSAQAPFVGRDGERETINATLEECVDEPVARVVLVTAPAGMGKSRLRREWVEAL